LQRARATDAHSDEAEGVWLRSSFLLVSLAETSYRLWVLSAQAKLDTAWLSPYHVISPFVARLTAAMLS